jgi:hypothetical protein
MEALIGQEWLAAERLIFGGATEEPPETASPKILSLPAEAEIPQAKAVRSAAQYFCSVGM